MAFLFDCYHYFRCKGENYRNGGLLLSSRFSHRLSQRGGKLKLKKRYSEHVFSFVLHNAGNVSHMLRLKDNSRDSEIEQDVMAFAVASFIITWKWNILLIHCACTVVTHLTKVHTFFFKRFYHQNIRLLFLLGRIECRFWLVSIGYRFHSLPGTKRFALMRSLPIGS